MREDLDWPEHLKMTEDQTDTWYSAFLLGVVAASVVWWLVWLIFWLFVSAYFPGPDGSG